MTAPNGSGMPPVFVVGTPRSGTTLTARVLGNHSRIFMPAETHFFDDIYARRGKLGELGSAAWTDSIVERLSTIYKRQHEGGYQKRMGALLADTDALKRLVADCRSYRDVFSGFMAWQMAAAGKVRWGNNVPRDIFNLTEILSFYPDARIVVCVRDIRDFLVSYGGMKSVLKAHHVDRHRRLFHPVVTSLLWTSTMRRIPMLEQQVPPENMMILRYEDLVREPEVSARRLCDLIGEEFEPDMLAISQNNSSERTTRSAAGGIYASSVGRWRNALRPEQAWLAQRIAGKWLSKLGYRAEPIAANPLRVAALLLTFPFALMRGLHANRAKRGALAPYVARRAASLVLPRGAGRTPNSKIDREWPAPTRVDRTPGAGERIG